MLWSLSATKWSLKRPGKSMMRSYAREPDTRICDMGLIILYSWRRTGLSVMIGTCRRNNSYIATYHERTKIAKKIKRHLLSESGVGPHAEGRRHHGCHECGTGENSRKSRSSRGHGA